MRLLLTFAISLFYYSGLCTQVSYELSMPEPHTHYFRVKMHVSDFKGKEMRVKLPVWAPGSYLVREFSKSIDRVRATTGKAIVGVEKVNKNTWSVDMRGRSEVTLEYDVYAFEISVRTSFLDASHGYVNGTSMFMYIDGQKDLAGSLTILPHSSFKKVTTALPQKESPQKGRFEFSFKDYDQLADCPIEIGNQEEFTFDAAGVKHTVAMYGPGNYDVPSLQRDMAKIIEAATAVFGENPNKEYVFIIHNLENGGGGLEHTNSTTLQVDRWTYGEEGYIGFLSLVAHEYFHLWNVKRLRPDVLGPFDYDRENYTTLLWVMEGFTSYYDELLLRRAGFYSEEDYLGRLSSTINYVEATPGNRVQPVAHASFDAWIKAYRPNENSRNTTISYYSKGQVLAAMIDINIVSRSGGKQSLDDLMKHLYQKYYKKMDRGFSEEEFESDLEKFMGKEAKDFLDRYVYDTQTIPYESYFQLMGIEITSIVDKTASLGISSTSEGVVERVDRGSSAYEAGINVKDEIIAADGFRVKGSMLADMVERMEVGDSMELTIARDGIMQEMSVPLKSSDRISYHVTGFSEGKEADLRSFWLRAN